jgi:hypothetical protein
MNGRRLENERLNKMQEDIEIIKNTQGAMCKSQERIEIALFGDKELNHVGLIDESKYNKKSIQDLNNFKAGIKIAAGVIAFIVALLTNVLLSLTGGN